MPQAIDAALELAKCYIHKGEFTNAMELAMSALDHPSTTDVARYRANELKTASEGNWKIKEPGFDSLVALLVRFIS